MKRNILVTAIFILVAIYSYAQESSLRLYTEKGETFTLYVNGEKQNKVAQSTVTVTNLANMNCKCKIVFSNVKLGKIEKVIDLRPGVEISYSILKNKKKLWEVKFVGEKELNNNHPLRAEPVIINQQAIPDDNHNHGNNNNAAAQPNGSVGVNYVDPKTGVSVNMNVNTGNNNGAYQTHTNVNTPNGSQTTTTTTTQTTTTTYGSQTYPDNNNNTNNNYNRNNPNRNNNKHHHEKGNNQQNVPVYEPVPGYTGAIGCKYPMTPENFVNVKQSIASKSFENTKLTIAKQVLNNNCLLTSQVKEILRLFDFENTKLEFAKYAYGYTYDLNNYYMLNDAFEFEHSITELNDYISKIK